MVPIVAFLAATAGSPVHARDDIRNNAWQGLEAFTQGHAYGELRPRYNRIDEDDKPLRASGGTYRAMLGWRSAPVSGLRFTLEGIATGYLGAKRFNEVGSLIATSPYPLLPDPRHVGVNQAFVEAAPGEGVMLKLGRQVVRLDNQRWLSDNDFRQIPQLYDGVTLATTALASTRIDVGHFRRARDTSGATRELRLTFARAAWNPAPNQSLSAYALLHDQPANGAFTGFADSSYRVAGLRFEGTLAVRHCVDATWVADIAQQRPFAEGDGRIRANYWHVGGGLAMKGATLRADYEVKGSNHGMYGLQTPLTDFYAWNGWTLHFFNTPREGLRDAWLTARWAVVPQVTVYTEAHRFHSDFGALDFGREWDVGATWEIAPEALLRLQHARYDAPSPGGDVRKTWLTLSWTY